MIPELSTPSTLLEQDDKLFRKRLASRQLRGKIWSRLFLMSIVFGILALALLFYNVIRQTYTLVVIDSPIRPETLANRPATELEAEDLLSILSTTLDASRMQTLVLLKVAETAPEDIANLQTEPVSAVLAEGQYPETLAETPISNLTAEESAEILGANLGRTALIFLVADEVFKPADQPLRELAPEALIAILVERLTTEGLRDVILREIAGIPPEQWNVTSQQPVRRVLEEGQYPAELADKQFGDLTAEDSAQVLNLGLSTNGLLRAVIEVVVHTDRQLDDLSQEELASILTRYINSDRLRVLLLEQVIGATQDEWRTLNAQPVSDLLDEGQFPPELATVIFSQLTGEQAVSILMLSQSRQEIRQLVQDEILQPKVVESWTLNEAVTNRAEIEKIAKEKYPNGTLEYRAWLNLDFLKIPMHSRPELSGLRTAILGSLWMMLITVLFAFPIGIGAAIYLEEYATDNWLNRIIQVNITNLAGVPSIIYGILGLAVFVRLLEPITSGEFFGATESVTASGRTILSAGLTMALLILPIVIINAQEAIRAVPSSLREASYGMGATKLQMIWTTILPNAMPGIMTGTILAISRAFGETAPLVVVGSITRITVDPDGPFSRFTAIPIQIYSWTAQPQDEFRSIAAAAIIVLLVILLMFNASAIILRNRFSKRW